MILDRDSYREHVQIAIGECKNQGEIDEEDILKLKTLAKILEHENLEVYIILAKLSEFSEKEKKLCVDHLLNDRKHVILLNKEQLEPYYLKINGKHPVNLYEMAYCTHEEHFGLLTSEV